MGQLNDDPTLHYLCLLNFRNRYKYALNVTLHLACTEQTNLLESSFFISSLSTVMVASPTNSTIKFLCSYGGKILPRYPDGKLRYNGGHTRVLAVPRSISFSG